MAQQIREQGQQAPQVPAQAIAPVPAQGQNGANASPKQSPKAKNTEEVAGAPERPKGNINNIPMSGELQQMLAKEAALKS